MRSDTGRENLRFMLKSWHYDITSPSNEPACDVKHHFFIVYQDMRKLKRWIIDNKNHEKNNTFLLTIICHGNKQGHLLDKNKSNAWDTEEFIGDLCEVEALIGKPKDFDHSMLSWM